MGSQEAFFGYVSVVLAAKFTSHQVLYVQTAHHEMLDGLTLAAEGLFTVTRFSKNLPSSGVLKGPGLLL